jgi:hypothetical protein
MVSLSQVIQYLFPTARPLIDYVVADVGNGPFIQHWGIAAPQPTQAEIDTATPLAQAAYDAAVAELAQLAADKAAMKTAYQTAVTRLQTISTATFANNGQRDTAIQDLAKYLLALAKVVKGLL